jgi:hypothetical protein
MKCVEGGREQSRPHLALALVVRGGEGDIEEAYRSLIEYLKSHPKNRHVRKAVKALEKAPKVRVAGLERELESLVSR